MWRPGQPPSCALCGGGGEALAAAAHAAHLGALLGPLHDPRSTSGEPVYVHRMCALWCPQVFQTNRGTLRNVLSEVWGRALCSAAAVAVLLQSLSCLKPACLLVQVRRARQIKCASCGRRGAATGCHVPSCPLSFHLPCAAAAGCAFEPEKYLLWCKGHAPAWLRNAAGGMAVAATPFPRVATSGAVVASTGLEEGPAVAALGALTAQRKQQQLGVAGAPGGASPLLLTSPPTEPPSGQRLGARRGQVPPAAVREHLLAARGALKRARRAMEAAAARRSSAGSRRRLGDESSDDDEHFRNKEARRLAADTAKLNPITLGGPGGLAVQHLAQQPVAKGALPGVVVSADSAAAAAIAGCDFRWVAACQAPFWLAEYRRTRAMLLLPAPEHAPRPEQRPCWHGGHRAPAARDGTAPPTVPRPVCRRRAASPAVRAEGQRPALLLPPRPPLLPLLCSARAHAARPYAPTRPPHIRPALPAASCSTASRERARHWLRAHWRAPARATRRTRSPSLPGARARARAPARPPRACRPRRTLALPLAPPGLAHAPPPRPQEGR